MSNANLTTTSYLVLGAVALLGRATPYDLKRLVGFSIGNFWSFPHSQLYAEPRRLAELGLLEEEREDGGRRRRFYSITDTGREELGAWVAQPTTERYELRDLALLKLFFGNFGQPGDVERLARAQEETHRAQLESLESLEGQFEGLAGIEHQLATLRMGVLVERLSVRFWKEISENPPGGGRSR